jgi:hypothetical protein
MIEQHARSEKTHVLSHLWVRTVSESFRGKWDALGFQLQAVDQSSGW